MLKYNFIKREDKPKFLVMEFTPELTLLTSYLGQIFDRECYEWIKDGVDSVLSGEEEFVERDTEWYGAHITKEVVTIVCNIVEDSEKDTVSTKDFSDVVDIWFKEKTLFEKEKEII